jgi:hypothetical protein
MILTSSFLTAQKSGFYRSNYVLKALVKRAATARTGHPTLSVPEAMRVATFTFRRVLIILSR